MKRGWMAGGLVVLTVGTLAVSIVAAQSPVLERGPYLQSTTRDSTIVVWQTDIPGTSVVEYGEAGFTQAITDTAPVTTHVISLMGLSAGTAYQYRIKTGGVELHQSTFATAPDMGGPLDFVVIGDSGTDDVYPAQWEVAARMQALDPDLILHTGDVIYPTGQPGGYEPFFFQPYGSLVDHVPVFPSLGNHDYLTSGGQPYLDVFHLPAGSPGGERYYAFDWGDAHFAALDSNLFGQARTDMLQWLESDLTATTATWKFAFFHHALYTSGPHRNDPTLPALRDALAPLFEQYNVDIVFNGHDHDYERSTPRRDYVPTSEGVVYIVSGGGGASLYPVVPQPFSAVALSAHHTVQVRIYGCILSLRAIDKTGAVIDQTALAKCPFRLYLPIILKGA